MCFISSKCVLILSSRLRPEAGMTCDPVLWTCLLLAVSSCSVRGQKYEGEICATGPNSFGECKRITSCDSARVDLRNGKRPEICSYDRNVPIVCCAGSSIVASPVSSGTATVWPSEDVATQRPAQRPTQRPAQRPTQRPAQRPAQRPTQIPTQRPVQTPTPLPPMVAVIQSAVTTQRPNRPQWWQIPPRKKTESPAVIDNLATTPLTGFVTDQLPPRLQGATEPPDPIDPSEEADRIIFNKNGR